MLYEELQYIENFDNKNNYPMTQCLISQKSSDGISFDKIVWLPTCKLDKRVITIKNEGVWFIRKKYSTMSSKDVIDNERDYTKHRKATDI